jgi:hypothetical protein
MPFQWREYLIVAHWLRNDPREGVQRTCLGRTYYYVFNLGLAKAKALNFREGHPGLHKKLWSWCQNHQDPNIKKLGTYGLRMHSLRIDADYYDKPIANLAGEVRTQLDRAQKFERIVAQSNGQVPPTPLGP